MNQQISSLETLSGAVKTVMCNYEQLQSNNEKEARRRRRKKEFESLNEDQRAKKRLLLRNRVYRYREKARAKESDIERAERLARDRERMAMRRRNETKEQKIARQIKDKERHAAVREWRRSLQTEGIGMIWENESIRRERIKKVQEKLNETFEQGQERKAKDRERHAARRMNETESHKAERRAKDRERHAAIREWKRRLQNGGGAMIWEKDALMKDRNRERTAEKRKNETDEQKSERKAKDRERHAARRAWVKNVQLGLIWDKMSQSNERCTSDDTCRPEGTQIQTANISSSNNVNVRDDAANKDKENKRIIKIKEELEEIEQEELIIEPDILEEITEKMEEEPITQETTEQFEFL